MLISVLRRRLISPLFPYTTLFRSSGRPRTMPGPVAWVEPATVASKPVVPANPTDRARSTPWNPRTAASTPRSEEHTSELQSHHDLVCRLLLEKKKAGHRRPARPRP